MDIRTEERPWGSFTEFIKNEKATVKIIKVEKEGKLSLQYHKNRDEFWKVLKGNPQITIGGDVIDAKEDDEFFIERGSLHRIYAPNDEVNVLEISLGEFDERDIVRIEDEYGRVKD